MILPGTLLRIDAICGGLVMSGGLKELGGMIAPRWMELAVGGGVYGALSLLVLRLELKARRRRGERRREEELAAYAELDVRVRGDGETKELAARVSRVVAVKSAFRRAAVMVRGRDGRLCVAASVGMEEVTVGWLNAWGSGLERGGGRRGESGLGVRVGARSFAVVLDRIGAEGGYRRAIVLPFWTMGGSLLGVLALGADGSMSVRRSLLMKALEPVEALALKVERALENAALAEKLMGAERLAGMGLLAGGMAHALNNPLTAVLGFAELIADTTGEARVREDAQIIVHEALRMRTTVETLLDFWRSGDGSGELVDVADLVRERAGACVEKLEERGVRMVVDASREVLVRGRRSRLTLVLEHLLNNAAQALANEEVVERGEELMIRVSVARDDAVVHLMVSDSGLGFREPERVFEGDRVGLGLSVCYGIVHEHGGEIRAFNLSPHGAAVAVELPVAEKQISPPSTGSGCGMTNKKAEPMAQA
jgi:signal transduction histidine kinase